MSKRSELAARLLEYKVLLIGVIVICGGIFGIWLQGEFYPPGLEQYTQAGRGVIGMAFFLPSAVTAAGCLLVAPIILCSSLTEKWSPERRAIVYLTVSVLVIGLCYLAGVLAAAKAA